jgi:DNA polymerase zeta
MKLRQSMEVIHSVKEWGAKVVYGDTDSLFVYLPGKTKEEAFRIGNEMADAVTKRNPAPVKLKFEKVSGHVLAMKNVLVGPNLQYPTQVYLPCVLMAKKRYVGAKYENLSDTEPVFDAKGIEVVRRDGIPALQKIQETCLKYVSQPASCLILKQIRNLQNDE